MQKPLKLTVFCPSISKAAQLLLPDDDGGVDLASIARPFGLDPSTVKINGYFISRGPDFVSTSVTWRSLLQFFSAKGLSTGKHHADALTVDGKLSKIQTKRRLDISDSIGIERKDSIEDLSLHKKLRLNETNSDFHSRDDTTASIAGIHYSCGRFCENMKRPRENDAVITATPCKRIR